MNWRAGDASELGRDRVRAFPELPTSVFRERHAIHTHVHSGGRGFDHNLEALELTRTVGIDDEACTVERIGDAKGARLCGGRRVTITSLAGALRRASLRRARATHVLGPAVVGRAPALEDLLRRNG